MSETVKAAILALFKCLDHDEATGGLLSRETIRARMELALAMSAELEAPTNDEARL